MTEAAWGENVIVMDHPLIRHKVSILRDVATGAKEFRELVRELAMLMAYEATRTFALAETTVTTPVAESAAHVLEGKKPVLVPILRAGLGMVDGILELIPAAKVGHLGMFRDPASLEPVSYYDKLPADLAEREVLVLDPMLATGGSASAAISLLKGRGARRISLLVLIAAPEGIRRVCCVADDVKIYTCAVDERLNDHGYIVPGLGDAGDRLFGTR